MVAGAIDVIRPGRRRRARGLLTLIDPCWHRRRPGVVHDGPAAGRGVQLRHRRPWRWLKADRIMARHLQLGTHPDWILPVNPTWREQPFNADLNWLFNYHALRWLLPLLQAGRDTGDTTYTARAEFLLKDWLASNPSVPVCHEAGLERHGDRVPGDPSWPVRRAISGRPSWLLAGLKTHGTALADPKFYVWHGNHALNQVIGLVDVACVLANATWKTVASSRMAALVSRERRHRGRLERAVPRLPALQLVPLRASAPPSDRLPHDGPVGVLASRRRCPSSWPTPRSPTDTTCRSATRACRTRPTSSGTYRRVRRDRRCVGPETARLDPALRGRLPLRPVRLGRDAAVRPGDLLLAAFRTWHEPARPHGRAVAHAVIAGTAPARGSGQVHLHARRAGRTGSSLARHTASSSSMA